MSDRVLLYTCCDNDYTHFVPLYCAAALFSNENIDIEIGINLNRLTDLEEEAMHNLMILHPESKIKIKYNFYSKKSMFTHMNALFDGKCMWSNTVRFVSVPDIKNKYTYIGDIDVVLLMKNFYTYHINIMNEYGSIWAFNTDATTSIGDIKSPEIMLYPSKNQRDWSKFNAPWYKKEKFDPKTLKAFDKVLVKGNKMDCVWKCSLHSHFDANYRHAFCANTGIYKMCIPYNEETKHLVGTTEEAPEYYRYWED